jgi:restriction system protein
MPIPDYQTLMLPLLKRVATKDARVPEIADHIADEFDLSKTEREQMLRSGKQRVLHNRLHWAKFYLSKAGLVQSTPGNRFVSSDVGRELLSKNPTQIDNQLLLQYPSFREFYEGNETEEGDTNAKGQKSSAPTLTSKTTPEEQIEAAHAIVHSALRAELIQRILQNSPSFFEQLIVDLLVAMGYGGSHQNAAEQLGRTGDGGVDGIINEDRLGLDRVYIQAKRFSETSIGRPAVQAFVGSLVGLGATKGVFVTTSAFTQEAIDFAKHLTQRIILINGNELTELMIEHKVGVRVSRSLEFKRLDEDFFAEED